MRGPNVQAIQLAFDLIDQGVPPSGADEFVACTLMMTADAIGRKTAAYRLFTDVDPTDEDAREAMISRLLTLMSDKKGLDRLAVEDPDAMELAFERVLNDASDGLETLVGKMEVNGQGVPMERALRFLRAAGRWASTYLATREVSVPDLGE